MNLDRQPGRWRRVSKELGRFRTSEGARLTSITRRLAAVDARDGRSVAATADVDPMYRVGDQLYVQPDARLAASFAADEPVRMTRQEVAVARSHVEAWKTIAAGADDFVLVLEDDAWFKPGARAAIDNGWRAALDRFAGSGGPRLLYLSYADAGGTALRAEVCDDLFRPVRGLWLLSGYVLSREGAASLLRAMPVVGPVDLWMNYRFAELGALALSSPAIAQRHDAASDNAYSIMPYLARAGVVDGGHGARPPDVAGRGPLLAWTGGAERESLAMALSMLGLRVRAFDGDEEPLDLRRLSEAWRTFDALVDPPLVPAALSAAVGSERTLVLLEAGARTPDGLELGHLPAGRSAFLVPRDGDDGAWEAVCGLLAIAPPAEVVPGWRDKRVTPVSGRPATLARRSCAGEGPTQLANGRLALGAAVVVSVAAHDGGVPIGPHRGPGQRRSPTHPGLGLVPRRHRDIPGQPGIVRARDPRVRRRRPAGCHRRRGRRAATLPLRGARVRSRVHLRAIPS